MKAIKSVIREQLDSIYLMGRLSLYELKQQYAASTLGVIWVFLNPLTQILVYWLVFGLGIRGGAPVEGVPFFVWMICGIIPWFFINSSIIQGSNSIYAKLNAVSKMNFPLSVIPTYVILSQLYTHMILLGVLLIIIVCIKGVSFLSIIGLIYCIFSTFCFLIALAFITSTISTISRDIHLFIQSITRMLFYLTPVLWKPSEHMSGAFAFLMKANPFYYVIEGYRLSLLHGDISFIWSLYTLYFWGIAIILFVIGSMFHIRFRKQFVDYL
ncbi:ABC transporter permease [Bacillus cereus]|uniref:Transport permease protein n=1 Tax=Bacillus thuringiensis serovar mexicanensis TaxID=180868 RepID=A0A242W1P6_BACTU|nr:MULTISPECIES: ABC transporter permease [Bacillus]MCU0094803.1 ABC transporter permease [Bacillus sp. OR9]MCU4991250.1 ABC transporter permease [Bacillus cereus]MDF2019132.1 ABC transporter permease [Bacillus sp. Cr_R3]MDF2032768.1 ABC transporter permease [Bacillus sp. Cr_R16]MEB9668028.1 ABC transporter permease [Bacillus anthracis]